MKKSILLGSFLALGLLPQLPAAPAADGAAAAKTWEFNEERLSAEWKLEAEASARPEAIVVKDGKVSITTRAQTWDRMKITTLNRQFGAGSYTWRVFVPKMGQGDMASVGAFIYFNDQHEMDFEIGSGSAKLRQDLKTAADEVVCYCTSQANPGSSTTVNIKANAWYDLKLSLEVQADGNYLARWTINGRLVKELKTQISAKTRFGIHCSVENLKFIGDHQPKQNHEAHFDRVVFTPHP